MRYSCNSWFPILAVFAVVVVASSSVTAEELTPAQTLIASPQPLVVAHRGNSSMTPENTLPAFQSAIDVNADLVELDYYHAADGVPVVIHDDTLDRTTDAEAVFGQRELEVSRVPLADLQKLDAGSWFAEEFAGAKLPTLAESLTVIQAGSVTLIERKAGDAASLVRMLDEMKLTDQVVVQAFDWAFIAECRRLSPRLVLGTLSGKPASPEQIRAAAATGADVIVWNHEKIGPQQIKLIHSLGKRAWVYTVNDRKRAVGLLAAGIDGIITDKPAEIMQLRETLRRPRIDAPTLPPGSR